MGTAHILHAGSEAYYNIYLMYAAFKKREQEISKKNWGVSELLVTG